MRPDQSGVELQYRRTYFLATQNSKNFSLKVVSPPPFLAQFVLLGGRFHEKVQIVALMAVQDCAIRIKNTSVTESLKTILERHGGRSKRVK